MGCEACEYGSWSVSECPQAMVRDLVAPLKAMELFLQGIPPITGGLLDQSAEFVDFVNSMQHEDALVLNDD